MGQATELQVKEQFKPALDGFEHAYGFMHWLAES